MTPLESDSRDSLTVIPPKVERRYAIQMIGTPSRDGYISLRDRRHSLYQVVGDRIYAECRVIADRS
jgi:hypothetical protein